MEFGLSPDQKLFRTTARDFLEREYPLERLRGTGPGQGGGFDRGWWSRAAELGWAAMLVPEDLGGGSVSGEGVRDLALLAEELGAGVAPGPLLATHAVLAGLVEAHGSGPDHAELIEALVAGETVASWAVYEPGGQWAPDAPATTATPTDGGYRLDGVKDRVEAAGQADVLLVTAATPEGTAQFLVPTDASGVSVHPQWSVDLVRSYAEVRVDGVVVDAAALVGAVGDTELLERQLQIAVVVQCAELCGGIERSFTKTLASAFDRFTFGRPLASYQALKHRFADMKTWLEACHATTGAAAEAVQERSPRAGELVSVAKSFVGERAPLILQDCIQMQGGIGLTWEFDLHLHLRRATVDQGLYGTPGDHRRRLADFAAL
jgi:alkylation response protein AidB-like acyl-CoA dehydrogenase